MPNIQHVNSFNFLMTQEAFRQDAVCAALTVGISTLVLGGRAKYFLEFYVFSLDFCAVVAALFLSAACALLSVAQNCRGATQATGKNRFQRAAVPLTHSV